MKNKDTKILEEAYSEMYTGNRINENVDFSNIELYKGQDGMVHASYKDTGEDLTDEELEEIENMIHPETLEDKLGEQEAGGSRVKENKFDGLDLEVYTDRNGNIQAYTPIFDRDLYDNEIEHINSEAPGYLEKLADKPQ